MTLPLITSRLYRWQEQQQMYERLWRLWSDDYVHSLQCRSKWHFEKSPIQVGQIVILRNDNLPPTKWNLGRVVKCHPGPDGLIRVVTVRTAIGEYLRPLSKLALLPVALDSPNVRDTPTD